MTGDWFVLVESNTTGSGRLFCACARRLGLRPVMLARDPNRYPYLAADGIASRIVTTAAAGPVLAACAELGGPIAGVTSSSEYSVGIASEVARALGLPHPDPDAIQACRDKVTQRIRLRTHGLPGPEFAAAATVAQAVAAAARIGYPVVVKPVAGSGSVAVRLCADADAVRAGASSVLEGDPAALALPPQGAVVVEQFLAGDEYSVETFDEQVIGVTRKHLGPHPYFVEVGHDFPAPLPGAERAEIGEMALAALRALGLGWGPAHVELRLTPAGPRIIEVNPRLAGGMIPRMVEAACGVDMIFHTVAKLAGRAMPPRPTRELAASIRFLVAEVPGRLTGVAGLAQARAVPGVVEVGLTRAVGQDITLTHSFTDRLGYAIAAAEDADAAAHAATEAVSALRPSIDTLATEGLGKHGI